MKDFIFKDYLEKVTSFHGSPAPGVILGGFMVEMAKKEFPEDIEFNAIAETPKSLPDAVQLLTRASYGNGKLKVVNLGKFALSLYDISNGRGVRVFLDTEKLEAWPEIKGWLFKSTPPEKRDLEKLTAEIHRAGFDIFSSEKIAVHDRFLKENSLGKISICSVCGEAYPHSDGGVCRGCSNESPYKSVQNNETIHENGPRLKTISVEDAIGRKALHDMTRIEPGVSKGPEIEFGQEITAGDVCRLQKMGKYSIYVTDESEDQDNWVHENDAVKAFAGNMAGSGITYDGKPEEGKVTFTAEENGLLVINRSKLERFNMVKDVMCATRHNYTVVEKDRPIAGSRAIPLYISRRRFDRAMEVLQGGPLFEIRPMRKAKVGILVTGTEVFKGLIKDRFIPIIQSKVEKLDCSVAGTRIAPDDRKFITDSVNELMEAGADLIITTAGLSVDPDDVTRPALIDAGMTDMVYGAPMLPGTMTLVGRIGDVQIIGVPACALYFKTTSFDLLLPRLLANLEIGRKDLAEMGEGGFCLNCRLCTYPKCPFGK